jgi:SAM-dependent methyltransferase
MRGYPLDLQDVAYAYLERPNRALLTLVHHHVFAGNSSKTLLDVGCGYGAHAEAIRRAHPAARVIGIEPHPAAAERAATVCSALFAGTVEAWLETEAPRQPFDAVILSDVLEHIVDPVAFLRSMLRRPAFANAQWIISVPNYAVWYNRLRTLAGRFDYTWSGLFDRTHVRFYTRRSLCRLLEYCGLRVSAQRCTASLVQSLAPWIRRRFDADVQRENHLALIQSRLFRTYQRFVEPMEESFCNLLPGLLGFQIVVVARRDATATS